MTAKYKTIENLSKKTKRKILICIRENSDISRLEIARLTGLSTATVTRIVDSLINDDDLVEERGVKALPKGRPRKPLHFKGYDKYVIGIDLGTTYIRGVLSDFNTEYDDFNSTAPSLGELIPFCFSTNRNSNGNAFWAIQYLHRIHFSCDVWENK